MNRQEHLMTIAMEECLELAKAFSKAKRFGYDDHAPNECETNREQIVKEFNDLIAAMEMAGFPINVINGKSLDAKIAKVEKFLEYSKARGTLS